MKRLNANSVDCIGLISRSNTGFSMLSASGVKLTGTDARSMMLWHIA